MLISVCAKYYVLEIKNTGDITKFSELPKQPSYNWIFHNLIGDLCGVYMGDLLGNALGDSAG